jgi:hypothetical protein
MRRSALMAVLTLSASCGAMPWAKARPTVCYPAPPTVTPDHGAPGALVTLESSGYGKRLRDVCGPTKPRRTYVIQMRNEHEVLAFGDGARRNRLGIARVNADTLGFRSQVTIPAHTRPGRYYVGFGRAPSDHYHAACAAGGSTRTINGRPVEFMACGGPPQNLTVVP